MSDTKIRGVPLKKHLKVDSLQVGNSPVPVGVNDLSLVLANMVVDPATSAGAKKLAEQFPAGGKYVDNSGALQAVPEVYVVDDVEKVTAASLASGVIVKKADGTFEQTVATTEEKVGTDLAALAAGTLYLEPKAGNSGAATDRWTLRVKA